MPGIQTTDATVMNPMVLIEATVYDKLASATKTLYLADRENYRTKSTDTPASTSYLGRVMNAGTIAISVLDAWSKGAAVYGIGELQFGNTDGALSGWKNYVFDGWPFTLYFGTLDASGALTRTKIFSGIMEQPDIGLRTVNLPVRTNNYGLDTPILNTTFAGTGGTAPPEGDSNVKGRIKPRGYGYVFNAELIPVDAVNSIYFVCDNPNVAEVDVHDAGLALAMSNGGVNYATLAALYAATVPPTQFNWAYDTLNTSGVYVKLGSLPTGQATANIVRSGGGINTGLDGVVFSVLFDAHTAGAVPTGDFELDLYYPLTGAYPHGVDGFWGIYVGDQRTYLDVLSQLAAGVVGWCWFASNAVYSVPGHPDTVMFGNFPDDDTLNAVSALIEDAQILDMVRVGNAKSPGESIPPFQVTYEFGHNETVQASGLAATVSADDRVAYGSATIKRSHKDTSVLTKYPLAQAINVGGYGLRQADVAVGQTMADKVFTALGQAPDFYRLKVKLTRALMTYVHTPYQSAFFQWLPCLMPSHHGAMLGVKTARNGFHPTGNGTKCGVLSVSLDLAAKEVTYLVWTTYRNG